MNISVIVPAYNEAKSLPETLQSLRAIEEIAEIIVVDDASTDTTAQIAGSLADKVVRIEQNVGKGEALRQGVLQAHGDFFAFIDGDLGASAVLARYLLNPVITGRADLCIAVFPSPEKKAGFGLVKGLAKKGIHMLTGFEAQSPLSGQRALTRQAVSAITSWNVRFGIEVGMTIDVLRAGLSVLEVPIPFGHRQTGRDIPGFIHRGQQFIDVGRMLGQKWRTSSGHL